MAAGAAAGIAATFNSPLGGIFFAIELLLISVNLRTVLPVVMATVTATYLGRVLLGTYPAFNLEQLRVDEFQLDSLGMLMLIIPFGILMGVASIIFIKVIYWTEDRFESMPGNAYTQHLSGMLLVGITMYAMWSWTGHYYIEGIGYATILDVLQGKLTTVGFLLALCLLKLAATCLTLGSGGSGGVFSPALYIGACLGAAFAILVNAVTSTLHADPVTISLAGMAAMVGAFTGAILTAAVMLHEMTGNNNIVLPVILTTAIACGLRKTSSPNSIYTLKLHRRGHIVPEGLEAPLHNSAAEA